MKLVNPSAAVIFSRGWTSVGALAVLIACIAGAERASAAVYPIVIREGATETIGDEITNFNLDDAGVPKELFLKPSNTILFERGGDPDNPKDYSDRLFVDGRLITFYSDVNGVIPGGNEGNVFIEENANGNDLSIFLFKADPNGGPDPVRTADMVKITMFSDVEVPETLGFFGLPFLLAPLFLRQVRRIVEWPTVGIRPLRNHPSRVPTGTEG